MIGTELSRRTLARGLLLGGTVAALGGSRRAAAQPSAAAFPNRPVRVVVPFGAGTSTDIMTRLVAPKMSEDLGQPVVVENRAGAGGVVGSEAVAKSPPDGHTLCMGSIASHSVNASLMPRLPYDVLRDFTPVSLVTNAPNLMVVGPSVPARTLQEFLAWAKAQRGGVSYASAGNGTSSHLAGELLKLRTGAPLEHVPYRSGAQAVTDVVAGQVPMLVYQVTAVLPFVRDGKLRAIAMASPRRHPSLPDVPTTAEAGLTDYAAEAWFGLFAPAATPPEIIARYAREAEAVLAEPAVANRALEAGAFARFEDPATLRARVERETSSWTALVKAVGIKAD